ncbi:MAG: HTTM domain-containing protein [Bdellovibrionales bacterium]|nr:HTTM domain-containing protein [Bdellovibrionales bacterium]
MMKHLFRPVDAAILIYFRFFAGLMLSIELLNSLHLGDLNEYLAPFHFSYLYFEWLKPWSLEPMVALYALTIISGFTLAVGFQQRLSAFMLFLGYTLLFLMEKSEYNNHLYLYCLISFWMIWMPVTKNNRLSVPAWFYYLLLFHMSVVYFYAGIAKLDSEWLEGHTVREMLNSRYEWFYIYGGLAFDLLIVPFLLWRKTRVLAFTCACVFHVLNVINFGLATFPWFSIAMTALYFGTKWPRRFSWFDDFFPHSGNKTELSPLKQNLLVAGLVTYCLLHLLIPFRHHLYSGKVSWTEDGHQFGWRMKLRNKTGDTYFYVQDPGRKNLRIVFPQQYLTKKQSRKLPGNPDFILQFAHFLRDKNPGAKIFASARISLNGKPAVEMVNNRVDLAKEERKLGSYHWIYSEEALIKKARISPGLQSSK